MPAPAARACIRRRAVRVARATGLVQTRAMQEQHLDIPTPDGAMNTFAVHPDEGGPHPLLLFFMDAPGKREELHDMARRFASAGYAVLLPNLYYRRTRDWWLRERTEPQIAVMFEHMASLDRKTTETDARALLDFVDGGGLPAADTARIGAVGYCMSGPIVLWAAAHFPQRFAAIASIHGANMVTDAADSPHRVVGRVKAEMYFACAETDRWAPPEHVAALQSALEAGATVPYRLETYPGTEHGFVFPQRACYAKRAAERHWQRLLALFGRIMAARTAPE